MYDTSGAASDRNSVVLNDIHIDIMDYIVPASCTDTEFRQMWAEFEWENKVAVNTNITDLHEYLDHLIHCTNMKCLTPEKVTQDYVNAGFDVIYTVYLNVRLFACSSECKRGGRACWCARPGSGCVADAKPGEHETGLVGARGLLLGNGRSADRERVWSSPCEQAPYVRDCR